MIVTMFIVQKKASGFKSLCENAYNGESGCNYSTCLSYLRQCDINRTLHRAAKASEAFAGLCFQDVFFASVNSPRFKKAHLKKRSNKIGRLFRERVRPISECKYDDVLFHFFYSKVLIFA
jgi:hypothetical protein